MNGLRATRRVARGKRVQHGRLTGLGHRRAPRLGDARPRGRRAPATHVPLLKVAVLFARATAAKSLGRRRDQATACS